MTIRLRAAAFAAWFYGITIIFGLGGLWVRAFARDQALALAQRWARVALSGLWPICRIRVVLSGEEHLPASGPALLASQHQSMFDTLIWMALLDRPSYVMKQELVQIPLFGPLLVPAGMIPVDRGAGAAALRGLLRGAAKAAADRRQIVIFPEGTRVLPGTQVKLHPGLAAIALRTGLPVLPVATDSGDCWPRAVFGKQPGVIHIAVGAAIRQPFTRETLLAEVEDYWRRMAADGFGSVDNSVDPILVGRRRSAANAS
jgi:1-acyl-sn-glycerol-3-phosphate acyltransferase